MLPKKIALTLSVILASTASSQVFANTFTDALTQGKTSANVQLRYESVSQDNALKDADAFTLRTRLTYATGSVSGFSALVEFEDSRNVLGVDDYNNTNGKNTNYSVIADPETTELDQFLLQYKQEAFGVKLGRQVLTLDNHRFVGHVGWRQDRQTFDGLTLTYQPTESLKLHYSYIDKRNRIFAQEKDIDAKDHLLNASFKTSVGKFTAYSYLLEVDNGSSNGTDTYGLRYSGSAPIGKQKIKYTLEYAKQDYDSLSTSYSADYLAAELGSTFSGVGLKVGYEKLGSDDGMYGFSTPLATLHKFNGWSDQFLNTPQQGLADLYMGASGKVAGGKWALTYHKFDADEASTTVDDLGSEINALYTKSFSKHYAVGVKLAKYSAGDSGAGKVDTDKVWLWLNAKF